jgi:hypothetical protein
MLMAMYLRLGPFSRDIIAAVLNACGTIMLRSEIAAKSVVKTLKRS